jgi:hypothetical protein
LRSYSALRERNESHTNRRYGAIRPVAAIALVFAAGLMLAIGAEAKPKHQPLKCKAGYTRRTVWIPQRVHGRIVRRHGRIVRVQVQRCLKTPQTKSTSPKSPPGGNPTTPTTPTTSRPPVTTTTTTSPTTTTTTTTTTSTSPTPPPPPPPPPPPSTGDPVVVAVGDIAQPHGCAAPCPQSETAALAQSFSPTAVLVLGDNQYDNGTYSEYTGSYDLSWGHAFNPIVHPVLGNHEYGTSGAAGYFQYFGANGVTTGTPGGYYSFNVGNWHILALNSNCSDQSGCSDAINGGSTSAERSWLQSDLAANRSACVLATWHHPLFSDGWTLGTPGVGGGIAQLWSTLYSAHADAVLNGHDHLYERYAQEDPSGTATASGIREFVVGTGGESLNGLSANTSTLQANSSQYGVLVMTLHASSYDWKFVTTSGATVDSGGPIACHGPGATIASVGSRRRFAPAAPVDVARLTGPPLVFDALPLRRSLASVKRAGLPVAVLASRAVDVRVTAWLRHGRRLTPIASFYETESQITGPHSVIRLRLPADRLKGMTGGTLVLRFAAKDGAGHRHTVTRTVRLR